MRLTGIDVRDFRSIFVDDANRTLTLELGAGMNTLIGLNNCGKSNVLRAISLALDPSHPFELDVDAPGPRQFALPIITLRFVADGSRASENSALAAADDYERQLGTAPTSTLASRGEITLQVAFQRDADGYGRKETLVAGDGKVPSNADDFHLLEIALARLRDAVRFVLIKSGESIESVLEGNFREILHSVVRERLSTEFTDAEQSRQNYIAGLQESLLAPLRDRLSGQVGALFPEIETILLSPEVPSIERTLSRVGVSLGDLVLTPLDQKGTGVRGGVLVAMLSYLALNATRSMVFAVEEPEAFLHPASQEDLRDLFDELAEAVDVSLLVTTHSPYLVTRRADGRIFCLAKDRDGRTRLAQQASGSSAHAPLIGGLFREATFEQLLMRASDLPSGAEGVLLVEGPGDELSLRLAAQVVGRSDLLGGIHIRPTGGTNKMIVEAVIARASIAKPMVILVDNDDEGRETLKMLCGQKFGFQKTKQVFTYAEVFPPSERDFPYEAEDLFDPALIQQFVDEQQPTVYEGSKKRPDASFHYDFGQAAKGGLEAFLAANAKPEHVRRWLELIFLLREKLKLPVVSDSVDELISAISRTSGARELAPEGVAFILTDALDYARYQEAAVLILAADTRLPDDLTHIGFYLDRSIQPVVPRVLADYPGLHISGPTAEQLRSTGKAFDQRAASVVQRYIEAEDNLVNTTRRLLLLSSADDDATVNLAAPVVNTKRRADRPVAWTVSPRSVMLAALATSPATTDELDERERILEQETHEEMRSLGTSFATRHLTGLDQDGLMRLVNSRPNIPRDVDARLLRNGFDALGRSLREDERRVMREAFWATVRAAAPDTDAPLADIP